MARRSKDIKNFISHLKTDTTGAPLLFAYALDCTSDVQLNYNNVLMWTQKSALTFNE